MSIPHRQCKTRPEEDDEAYKLRMCQFLIGNVKHLLGDEGQEVTDYVSIPHRQCKTTAFISFFLHHTPHALQNQLFSLKKYVDLFYVRIAVTRAFTGFTDIFLHSENLMLRSTYFSIMYPELFTAQGHYFHGESDYECNLF